MLQATHMTDKMPNIPMRGVHVGGSVTMPWSITAAPVTCGASRIIIWVAPTKLDLGAGWQSLRWPVSTGLEDLGALCSPGWDLGCYYYAVPVR